MRRNVRALTAHVGAGARRWWSIVLLLPEAGPLPVVSGLILNLLVGVLPMAFAVGASVMIDRLPASSAGSAAGWTPALTALALAVGALVLQSALAPLHAFVAELITRRIDGLAVRRLLRATLVTAPMEQLEEQDVLDRLSEIRNRLLEWSATPGAAAAALLALVARYAQLGVAVTAVGIVMGPWTASAVAATALIARFGSRGSLTRFTTFQGAMSRTRRKVEYLWRTASDIGLAKESRVLGILGWWSKRARGESDAYYGGLWRERRRVYLAPYLWISAVVLAGATASLITLALAAPRLTVLEFTLAIQAVLVPLRFGTYFPECDAATEFGMAAWGAIVGLEERFRNAPEAPGPGGAAAGGRLPEPDAPHRAIRFENVRFGYRGGERPVVEGLDLELRAGTSTAIVGYNGAGKTTLVKLLSGLYQPQQGTITVDGTPLQELDPRAWRRHLAVIFQDFVRYELDATKNIALGAPHAPVDSEAVLRSARRAGVADVLESLPSGLATPLSSRFDGGVDLSGGQWQRVALARALYAVEHGATMLLLDEPTAQLDVRAELAFFDRFLELTRGLTTVVISHRFSTVRRADRIVVLEGGRIGEQGTHEELMEIGGRYAELFDLQARRFSSAGGGTGRGYS